jgi:hypothetical protein
VTKVPKKIRHMDRRVPCSISLSAKDWGEIEDIIKTQFKGEITTTEFFEKLFEDYKRKQGIESLTLTPGLTELIKYNNQVVSEIGIILSSRS